MKRLGFIGVGMMGKPMAKNLLKAGYELTVLDVNTAAAEELVGEGAVRAGNPVEVMSQCEAVITMLPGSADVEQVVLGEQGTAVCDSRQAPRHRYEHDRPDGIKATRAGD